MCEHTFQIISARRTAYPNVDPISSIRRFIITYSVDVFCTKCERYYIIDQDGEIVHEY